MSGTKITKEDHERRAKAWAESKTLREAARKIGLSEAAMGYWVKKHGDRDNSTKAFILSRPEEERERMRRFFARFDNTVRSAKETGKPLPPGVAHRFIETYRSAGIF